MAINFIGVQLMRCIMAYFIFIFYPYYRLFFLLYIIILLLFMPMLDHSFIKLPSKLCKAYASIDLLNVDFNRL